jgi:hypothetical protein
MIVEQVTLVLNGSLTGGRVSADWKTSNVKPIYKKGLEHNPGNYRPVFLTSVSYKLMDSVLKSSIAEHLMSNELIHPSQHGFMPDVTMSSPPPISAPKRQLYK